MPDIEYSYARALPPLPKIYKRSPSTVHVMPPLESMIPLPSFNSSKLSGKLFELLPPAHLPTSADFPKLHPVIETSVENASNAISIALKSSFPFGVLFFPIVCLPFFKWRLCVHEFLFFLFVAVSTKLRSSKAIIPFPATECSQRVVHDCIPSREADSELPRAMVQKRSLAESCKNGSPASTNLPSMPKDWVRLNPPPMLRAALVSISPMSEEIDMPPPLTVTE